MNKRKIALTLAALLGCTPPLGAQADPSSYPGAFGGISFLVGEPTGDFSKVVDRAWGLELTGRIPLDPAGFVNLRGDLGALMYGHDSKRVCFQGVGCRVEARMATSNNIIFGGIGPELAFPGRWVRPYVHALLGFGYFNTTSSLEPIGVEENQFTTENFGDGTFSWGAGFGLEVSVHGGGIPVSISFGARYHEHGVMEYLTKGDIVDNPDGSITLNRHRSEANLITYRFGVSLGIPRARYGH